MNGAYLRAVISPSISGLSPHIASIVAKKHGKLAVTRNSYRRAVMDAVSVKLSKLPNQTIVFLMQKAPELDKTLPGTQARKAVIPLITKDVLGLCDQIIKKYGKTP